MSDYILDAIKAFQNLSKIIKTHTWEREKDKTKAGTFRCTKCGIGGGRNTNYADVIYVQPMPNSVPSEELPSYILPKWGEQLTCEEKIMNDILE